MVKSKKWIWFVIIVTVMIIWWPNKWTKTVGSYFNKNKTAESIDTTENVKQVLIVENTSSEDESLQTEEEYKILLNDKELVINNLNDSIYVLNQMIYDLKYEKVNKTETSLTDHIKNNTKFVNNENTENNEKIYLLPSSEYSQLKEFLTNRYSDRDSTDNK